MNTITLSPEMTLTAAAEAVITTVFARETHSVNVQSRDLVTWESLDMFSEPLAVQRYVSDDGIQNYGFTIRGERADEMTIFPGDSVVDELTLADDAYGAYFFERFTKSCNIHPYIICLRTALLARQQHLYKQKLLKEQEQRNGIGLEEPIKIINKRKIV